MRKPKMNREKSLEDLDFAKEKMRRKTLGEVLQEFSINLILTTLAKLCMGSIELISALTQLQTV